MKRRWVNLCWIVIAILLAGDLIYTSLPSHQIAAAQKALAKTRQALRQQGFKTDLTDFDFSTSAELRAREAAINATAPNRNAAPFLDHPNLMEPTGSNNVIVVWEQSSLRRQSPSWPDNSYELTWEDFRQAINQRQPRIDAACAAILSGPIQFNLKVANGNMFLPNLTILSDLTQILDDRAMLALHDGDRDAAWTNLMAATRLVTAWKVEPAEVSHQVQFGDAELVFGATWQVLQTNGWTDAQLAQLQHEWESVDFFVGLPEIQAFRRASDVKLFEHDELRSQGPRSQLDERPREPFNEFFQSGVRYPDYLWQQLNFRWSQGEYFRGGKYVDEKRLLLFYRDREIEFRNVVQAGTWLQMSQLPGVTNEVFFAPKYSYRGSFGLSLYERESSKRFEGQGVSFLGHAAEAETERRILITALALERYREKYGAYPQTLQALAPEFLPSVPLDFMNGQPLHYQVAQDGHFLLYSVGLDCVDNGGKIPTPPTEEERYARLMNHNLPVLESDIVWPLAASSVQTTALRTRQGKELAEQVAAVEARGQAAAMEGERLRQDTIKSWLALKPPFITNEPVVQGKPLSRILQNTNTARSAALSLDELLALKKINTGDEPDMATYEVPVSYDALKDKGELHLLVDGESGGEAQECDRATNGDCLLAWNMMYDPPGQHALRAQLFYGWGQEPQGPVSSYFSTNVVQIFQDTYFTDEHAFIHAKTAGPHAVYNIQLKTADGKIIKAFNGTTTNGIINLEWDLRDDHGNKYTNNLLESVFNVNLPDSGRSQTVK